MIAQEGLLNAALLYLLDDAHFFALVRHLLERVLAAVVHRRGQRHGRGVEGLHLVGFELVLLQPQAQVQHVLVLGAGVGRDEVGNQVLHLAGLLGEALEHVLEGIIGTDAGLHHLRQGVLFTVLRGDLEIAAHVVGHQLLDIFRVAQRQVITQARRDRHALDAGNHPRFAVELRRVLVVRLQVLADGGVHAGQAPAVLLDGLGLAVQPVHVGRGPAQVGDGAGEAWHLIADVLDFLEDRFFRAALDDPPFVFGDGAERAAAEAAAHDVHRGLDHVVGGNLRIAIHRVRTALVGQVEHAIHLVGFQRNGRRVHPDFLGVVLLHQHAGVVGIGFLVQHARSMGIQRRVVAHLVEGGQADVRGVLVQVILAVQRHGDDAHGARRVGIHGLVGGGAALGFRVLHLVGVGNGVDLARPVDAGGVDLRPARRHGVAHDGRAADVRHVLQALARRQAMGHFHHGALGIAIEQDVGIGIDQH